MQRDGVRLAEITLPAILIKIAQEWHPGLSADQLYERARRYWRCSPLSKASPPRLALCVAEGLIREVYEIDRWEVYPDMGKETLDPTRRRQEKVSGQSRRGFVGRVTPNETLRRSLVGTGVLHLPFGSGNPIAYINCGRR